MTTTTPSHCPDSLVMICATYPNGSVARYVVTAEDVDSELSFYYGLASVITTALTPEQAVAVAPIMTRLADLTALIEAQPAPYLCTAADRATIAGYMVDTDTAVDELDKVLDSFGFALTTNSSEFRPAPELSMF